MYESCAQKLCSKTVLKNCAQKRCSKTVLKNGAQKRCSKTVLKNCVRKLVHFWLTARMFLHSHRIRVDLHGVDLSGSVLFYCKAPVPQSVQPQKNKRRSTFFSHSARQKKAEAKAKGGVQKKLGTKTLMCSGTPQSDSEESFRK